jgi:hypothetical protein
MLTAHTVKDLDIQDVASCIPFKTSWGKATFLSTVTAPVTDIKVLKSRQLPLLALRKETTVVNTIKELVGTIQVDPIRDLYENTDPRIKESVEQILWSSNSVGSFLNKSPIALNGIITWKTLFLPFIAVMMPLVALVIPYVILRFTQPDISTEQYLERMRHVLLQQITIPVFLKSRNDADIIGFLLERLFIGITLVTFISSIWNQITPAIHLRHIWFTLESQGQACIDSILAIEGMRTQLVSMSSKKQKAVRTLLRDADDILEHIGYLKTYGGVATYAYFYNDKTYLEKIIAFLGKLDVLVHVASLESICFPRYVSTITCSLTGVYHPIVPSCISNDFQSTHAVLTGPNRGGKSTYCKAVGLAVVTAQTWGFAWADSCTLSPFGNLQIALTPAPALGESSTFESEIDFAKSVLAIHDVPSFVMMDEIFHSTNAYDGVQASRIFLSQLYAKPNVVSMISTHYHELAKEFTERVTPLYMDAVHNEQKKLTYSYKVRKGISNMSSVMEILEERGLIPGAVADSK